MAIIVRNTNYSGEVLEQLLKMCIRDRFMHEVKTNVLEMVNAVTLFRRWLEQEADAFTLSLIHI